MIYTVGIVAISVLITCTIYYAIHIHFMLLLDHSFIHLNQRNVTRILLCMLSTMFRPGFRVMFHKHLLGCNLVWQTKSTKCNVTYSFVFQFVVLHFPHKIAGMYFFQDSMCVQVYVISFCKCFVFQI